MSNTIVVPAVAFPDTNITSVELRTGDIIYLKAFNDRWLQRITDESYDSIEPASVHTNYFCQFKLQVNDNGTISLKTDAGDGLWISLMSELTQSNNYYYSIQPAKQLVDEFCCFKVLLAPRT